VTTPVSDEAVAVGASAVAAFADHHRLHIPPDLREDLARQVLTAAASTQPVVPADGSNPE
jgi:hypothetical protein